MFMTFVLKSGKISTMNKRQLFYSLFFTIFLLTYMIVLSVTDGFAARVPELNSELIFHYLPSVTRIIGFVSFAISRRFLTKENPRRIILLIVNIVFIISSAILVLYAIPFYSGVTDPIMITALFTLSLSIGHLGGLIYYIMSSALVSDPYKGRILGSSCAVAVLIQWLMTGHSNEIVQLIMITILFLILTHLAIRPPADYILEDNLPYAGYDPAFKKEVSKQLLITAAIILICTAMACRIDIMFSTMSLGGDVNIYAFPRLFIIPGYLILGYFADRQRNKLYSSMFFIGILSSAILMIMPFYNAGYNFFLSIYYLYIGFYIFFYTYSYISLAPRTDSPELWASFGRPLSDVCTAVIIIILMALPTDLISPLVYALINLILLIVLYLIIVIMGVDPDLTVHSKQNIANGSEHSAIHDIEDFLNAYPLTPRETDVATLLINTDMAMKAIATELGISERTVYRYSSSIYEKTGADDRVGLVKLYMSYGS